MTAYRKEGNFEKPYHDDERHRDAAAAHRHSSVPQVLASPLLGRALRLAGHRDRSSRSCSSPAASSCSSPTRPACSRSSATTWARSANRAFAGRGPGTPAAKVSVRTRNHNVETLKVNDKRGNPVEIGAVVVWRVEDTAQAKFDVEDFENFVRVQSESALRHVATRYNYDTGEDHEIAARGDAARRARTRWSAALREELQVRVQTRGREDRGGEAHAPRLRPGDRRRDAAPPAGRGGDRRAHARS